tara:strand:+ start:1692 stop:1883 length:192 start_codon:yes stop_codon:yes gene_type:complete
MVRARRKAEWSRAGTIAAAIYNVNRGQGKRVIKPSDFCPELDEASGMSLRELVKQVQQVEKKQ